MKKSKLILLLALVLMSVLLVGGLTSCGEEEPDETTAPVATTTAAAVTTAAPSVTTTATPVYNATFVYDDPTAEGTEKTVVAVVPFEKGDTTLAEVPAVPVIPGYVCSWPTYRLGTKDVTVTAQVVAIATGNSSLQYEKVTCDTETTEDDYYVVTKLSGSTDTSVVIPATHREEGDEAALPVKAIAAAAFEGNEKIVTVYISDSVVEIGAHAFAGCVNVETLVLSAQLTKLGAYAFFGTAITEVSLPATLSAIEEQTFGSCTELASVTFAEGLLTVGKGAFASCTSLTSALLPSTVTKVNALAFFGNSSLTELVLPHGLATPDASAFYGCTALSTLTANANALANLPKENLTSLTITEGSTTLYYAHLAECYNLTSLSLPASMTTITPGAANAPGVFSDCLSLATVTVADGNTVFVVNEDGLLLKVIPVATPATDEPAGEPGEGPAPAPAPTYELVLVPAAKAGVLALDGSIKSIADYAAYNCTALTEISFGGVTAIGTYAFAGCTSLTSLTLPDGCALEANAFADCTAITSIVLPAGCTVDVNVFSGCTGVTQAVLSTDALASLPKKSLVHVTINGGTAIAKRAFYNCTALETIVIPASVTTVGSNAFWGCQNAEIFCEVAGKPDGWSADWNGSAAAATTAYWAGSWTVVEGVPTPVQP